MVAMTRRGWIISVIACLAAGVLVTIGVAWAGAAWTDMRGQIMSVSGTGGLSLPIAAPGHWRATQNVQEYGGRFASRTEWAGLADLASDDTRAVGWRLRHVEAGWPWRSMRITVAYEYEVPRTSDPAQHRRVLSDEWGVLSGGMRLPEWVRRVLVMKSDRLPLRPMWPGWALSTGLYAGLAWLWFVAPRVWLRAQRRRRGECEGCGYELAGLAAGSVCPECGRGRTEQR